MFRTAQKRIKSYLAKRNFQKTYAAEFPVDLDAIAEFRGDAFPKCGSGCWIDQPDALYRVDEKVALGTMSESDARICRKFIIDGYYIAPGLIADEALDACWRAYEEAIAAGVIELAPEPHGEGDPYPGRRLDPHIEVPEIRQLQWHREVLRITDLLFGRKTLPFQTIMGHKGSSQLAHSDAIHMTTYPLGFLIANWVAFEDIHPDSGPLVYYPGSHRLLPYLLSAEVGILRQEFKVKGYAAYNEKYEPAMARHLEAYGLQPQTFIAQKGDVLFWHANLVHGGAPRADLGHSRKALVCHYFAERAFTYHDLSGNRTRLHKNGLYAPPVVDPPLAAGAGAA